MPKKIKSTEIFSSKEYITTLTELKTKIRDCQLRAISAANKELVHLYWTVGQTIVQRQENSGWGSKFIEKLAMDLQNEFPGIEGFSRRNLFRMRAFYLEYKLVPPAVALVNNVDELGVLSQIPWSHNIILMEKLDDVEDRIWYAHKTLEHGWSRDMLGTWIDSKLHKREGKALTNFRNTLPPPHSDLAQQSIKDPYLFDFLTLHENYLEKDLEDGLLEHIQKFLLELGHGFAFMGSQYPIVIDGDTSYIDLLFYHVKLQCFVVIEIKARAFKPEDTGQLNFYLSAVDDLLKTPKDNPTIGILLCKSRNKIKAEYAFRHISRPIGVVEYEILLTKALPEELKSSLPTVKEIEDELQRDAKT